MTRVASLYLPMLAIERLRRLERPFAPPDIDRAACVAPLPPIDDDPGPCSVPRGGGWRPGARWARDGALAGPPRQAEIDALPVHQRPTMREMGRRSEPADHPFKAMAPDDGTGSVAPIRQPAFVPGWSRPRVLIERIGQRDLVSAACPLALELGLTPGTPAAQARALVSDLDVRDAEPAADAAFLDRLALHAVGRWTPTVSVSGSDGLWLDLTGTTHLFGGERRFCARLLRFLGRLGYTAAIAIAGSPGAAHALARFSGEPITILAPRGEAEALADLPLAALRLSPEALTASARFGLERIADLYGMARGPLARRLGLGAVERLDQARGLVPEPITGIIPFEAPAVRRRLLEPIATAEAIEQVMGDLVDDLAEVLQARHLGLRAAVLTCLKVDGTEQKIGLGTARATREARHLKRMLAMRIDRIEPGLGIEEMMLAARRVESLGPEMVGAELGAGERRDIAPLIDQLAGRAGEGALFRVSAVESDIPERAVRRVGPLEQASGWPTWERPARLLRRPERLSNVIALLPDQPPRRFFWRGKAYQVTAGDGPERFHGEWWQAERETWLVRDYFRVEATEGERFWLFRYGDGVDEPTGDLSWYMHGFFG